MTPAVRFVAAVAVLVALAAGVSVQARSRPLNAPFFDTNGGVTHERSTRGSIFARFFD